MDLSGWLGIEKLGPVGIESLPGPISQNGDFHSNDNNPRKLGFKFQLNR